MYTEKIKKIEEGFTIVETLIVLAIAALILAIVLIAVPDLQRSAKNTDMTQAGENLVSGINSFEGNNNGALPTAIAQPDTSGNVTISSTVAGAVSASQHVGNYVITVQSAGTADAASGANFGTIFVQFSAECPTPSQGSSITPTASSRETAVDYTIETSGGNYSEYCLQS
ncbi:MAG TPA: prepilin-type N-terminal cleavage/methylation domain-containing protein [Candidatus Saccharimonadales bacterium]|jgi:prepilin-type N-terminal cleavage/methylation domain-containing protein